MHELFLKINHSGTICPPLQINAVPSVHKLCLPSSISSDEGQKTSLEVVGATLSYQKHLGCQVRIRYTGRRTYSYQGLIVSHSDEHWSQKKKKIVSQALQLVCDGLLCCFEEAFAQAGLAHRPRSSLGCLVSGSEMYVKRTVQAGDSFLPANPVTLEMPIQP